MNSGLESFRLLVFQTAAEHLSFTQAAEVLHLSQPAVTSHIKELECELGVRLFERSAGRVRITPAGELLYAYAADLRTLSQEVLRKIGQLSGEERGTLLIGASTTIAQYVLPPLLVEFVKLHPRARVSMTSANTQDIVDGVIARRQVIGLIEGPSGTSDLKTEDFLGDEIVVIVSPGHPWARRGSKPPDVKDLAAQPLVLREPGSGTRRVVEDALKRAGAPPRDLNIVMELDSTEAIKSGIEAGMGVGFVSKFALRQNQSGAARAIQIQGLSIRRQFQFIYPHGPEPSGVAGAFLRLARDFRDRASKAPIAIA